MEITGKIHHIFDEKKVSEKFSIREFVLDITVNEKYQEYLKIQCSQDRCEMLDYYKVGDTVNVFLKLTGRKYEKDGKVFFFNTIQCTNILKFNKKESDGIKNEEYSDELGF